MLRRGAKRRRHGGRAQIARSGLISYARGRIKVLDRKRLQKRSCECYQVVKDEYDRLLPLKMTG